MLSSLRHGLLRLLGSVAARNIVRGPQPGVAFPFSQSEITSAVKTSAEFILADGFGKNLFMPEYATDSQPYSIVGIMRNILRDDDRGIDSAHSEWAGDPHRSSSFRSSANYRWGGTGISEAAGTLGISSGLSSKSDVAVVNPRVDTGNSGGKFKLTRVNQTFDSGRVSYDNRIGKDPSVGKDPSNDNHSAVFERDLTASILADGLRDDRVEARGGYRGSLGSPHSFGTSRPSADYAWGGAVVSDNGSTPDPVPSSASETVIAAVADPLPVNSSSKFNLATVTPDDLFTTVTCNSEDPSSSRLPADDVVDSTLRP